jgi:hypothetical protein
MVLGLLVPGCLRQRFHYRRYRQNLLLRIFLQNLFFLTVPDVALFLPLSMNRSSAILYDRSFQGQLRSGITESP